MSFRGTIDASVCGAGVDDPCPVPQIEKGKGAFCGRPFPFQPMHME